MKNSKKKKYVGSGDVIDIEDYFVEEDIGSEEEREDETLNEDLADEIYLNSLEEYDGDDELEDVVDLMSGRKRAA